MKPTRDIIAFGPRVPNPYTPGTPFIDYREGVGAGATLTSKPLKIDHHDFAVPIRVQNIFVDDAGATNFDLSYQTLAYYEDLIGGNWAEFPGGLQQAQWNAPVSIVAGSAAALYEATVTIPRPVQYIRLVFKNNVGVATPSAIWDPAPYGHGLHTRITISG